jgi:hypothetical protein
MIDLIRIPTLYLIAIAIIYCEEIPLKPVFEYNAEGGLLVTGYLGKSDTGAGGAEVKQGLWVMYYADGTIFQWRGTRLIQIILREREN